MHATYSFVSHWRLPVAAGELWDELERMLRPGADRRWWPGLALPMAPRRLVTGERMVLAVRSPLGYGLRMRRELVEVEPRRALAVRSDGDLRGEGRLEVEAGGAESSTVTFRWDVETRKTWMNVSAWALRPVFERAHAHVMRSGERGMRALLDARRSEPRNAGNPRFSSGGSLRAG